MPFIVSLCPLRYQNQLVVKRLRLFHLGKLIFPGDRIQVLAGLPTHRKSFYRGPVQVLQITEPDDIVAERNH